MALAERDLRRGLAGGEEGVGTSSDRGERFVRENSTGMVYLCKGRYLAFGCDVEPRYSSQALMSLSRRSSIDVSASIDGGELRPTGRRQNEPRSTRWEQSPCDELTGVALVYAAVRSSAVSL